MNPLSLDPCPQPLKLGWLLGFEALTPLGVLWEYVCDVFVKHVV